MPCYSPPPTKDEMEHWARAAFARGDYRSFMSNVTKEMLSAWLCDALRGDSQSEMCRKWWELHKRHEGKT